MKVIYINDKKWVQTTIKSHTILTVFCLLFCLIDVEILAQTKLSHVDQKEKVNSIFVSFASTDKRYEKSKFPKISRQTTWAPTAWRGEKINHQILIWTDQPLDSVHVIVSDLIGERGSIIDTGQIKTHFVEYVITDGYFGNGCDPRENSKLDSSLVVDILDTISAKSVPPGYVQPVWLQVQVPTDVENGIYSGKVLIKSGKSIIAEMDIQIDVSSNILPSPKEWTFHLDLWQHPVAIARINNTEIWSDEHFQMMKPYYEMLANAGQKVITASIINEPWGHQTYDDYPSLIKWIKRKDGSWMYDFSLFDQYISFVMSCGIDQKINCYTMVPWDSNFTYYDDETDSEKTLKAECGTQDYIDLWKPFLKAFTQHLKERNWFSIAAIAMDERPLEAMFSVINLLKEIDPNWRIALAGNYHKELVDIIDDYSVFKTHTFSAEELIIREKQQKITTFYTSCEGEHPNVFTFSPPWEARWLCWYALANGFNGYLRWAYNSWPEKPSIDTRYRRWPAGDTFLIYPGPRSSVRFEKLIEGIQDFEKVKVLKVRCRESDKIEKLNNLLRKFDMNNISPHDLEDANLLLPYLN